MNMGSMPWRDELTGNNPDAGLQIVPLLASVCDELRIQKIMETWRPDTVYHAAAYKHVPLVEKNPVEGVKTNIFGTVAVARQRSIPAQKGSY